MSLVTRSIPGLFGGVSQQIPAMRHPTQCSEQDNGVATLVDGLYKRHGTKHVRVLALNGTDGGSVAGSYGNAYAEVIDKGEAGLFQLVIVNGNLMLYDMRTGAEMRVQYPRGRSYLNAADPSTAFRCVTVADYTFIVNTARTTALKVDQSPPNPTNAAYVYVKTAVPKVRYVITVNGTEFAYTTGDSPTSESIANSLVTELRKLGGAFIPFVLPGTNIVKVVSTGGAFTCSASDGWGNQAMKALHPGVDKFADLPPAFEQGYVLPINGTADSADERYYVRWTGTRWEETTAPGTRTELDPLTMPHQLRADGAGGWVFEPVPDWGKRLVGDDNTNPVPSFVGAPIRGVFFFRNRLGFLAGDSLVLSRAGSYFNFWSSTATQVLDTDPIDLPATSESVESLDWAVPYNQSLVVWASSKQQFILTGGDTLTPATARLQPSTTFETFNGVKPATLGNQMLFASTVGSNTQLNLYKVAEDRVTNKAEDVTEHAPNYVPAMPLQIAASTTVRAAVVVPPGPSKELCLFKWETDANGALTQSAWSKIKFETPDTVRIMSAYWSSRTLYLLTHVQAAADAVAGGRFVIETLDFEEGSKDEGANFALRLDNRVRASSQGLSGGNTKFFVPYIAPGQLTLLKCVTGQEPEQLTIVSSVVDTWNAGTVVTVQGDHQAGIVYAGRPFKFRYVFTETFLRDKAGLPIMAASVKLVRMLVRYVDTGWFTAKVTPLLRGTYEYPFSGRSVGMPGQGPRQLSLSTGTFSIPVQTRAANVEVVLESDSYLPCKFPYAEWTGDVTMKAQR